jgi:hypothetical protein
MLWVPQTKSGSEAMISIGRLVAAGAAAMAVRAIWKKGKRQAQPAQQDGAAPTASSGEADANTGATLTEDMAPASKPSLQ